MRIAQQTTFTFSRETVPLFEADPGEPILFRTLDCYSGQITSEDAADVSIDFNRCNPATGPVAIAGARPGDTLAVDILDIRTADRGVTCTLPEGGPLWDTCQVRTRILPIRDGVTEFRGLRWRVEPMIGVIGTAPAGESCPSGHPFPCGGNLDCARITRGSRVYLPVQVPGALLGMGDLHASMGDGEITGTGLEVAGEVLVNTRVVPGFQLNWPVVETADMWYVCACHLSLDEAIRLALHELSRLMTAACGWDATDAALYLSLQGSVEMNQTCLSSAIENVVRAGVRKNPAMPPLIP